MYRTSILTKALSLLLVGALALLASACSGTDAVDKQDYIKKNNKIQEDAAGAMNGLDPTKPESLDTAAKELDAAADELDKLDVPKDYQKEHDQMVEALHEQGDIIREMKSAVSSKDPSKISSLTTRLSENQTKFNSAIEGMNKDLA